MERFDQRKKDVLSKEDKSSIGSWDEKIRSLCEMLNSCENYYTTSSCAGRIVLMVDRNKKEEGLFRFVSHDKININGLLEEIEKLDLEEEIKFKQEPPILHIACRELKDARKLLKLALKGGWKKSGIISCSERIVVELNCSEKIEFPFVEGGRILVSETFLDSVVKKSNENLTAGWKKIERLRKECEILG
jgi:tRNA wybutosine-synthesizing protein 3